MVRGYLINHLQEQGCYPEDEHNNSDVAELWVNCITGDICYVPHEKELSLMTYCHIIFELKIDPPLENGYESDFHVYVGWKEHTLKKAAES